MIAEVCTYCGRKNLEGFPNCADCGTVLTDEPIRKKRSTPAALALALIFGPLGLSYTSPIGCAITVLVPIPVFIVYAGPFWAIIGSGLGLGPLWFTVSIRLICCGWAFIALWNENEAAKPEREALRLLHEAANLEGTDREKAILTYEEVIRSFPNTSASQEAARNIEILKKSAESHS